MGRRELCCADEQHYHRCKADLLFAHALLALARVDWNVQRVTNKIPIYTTYELLKVLCKWANLYTADTFVPPTRATLDTADDAQIFVAYLFARL